MRSRLGASIELFITCIIDVYVCLFQMPKGDSKCRQTEMRELDEWISLEKDLLFTDMFVVFAVKNLLILQACFDDIDHKHQNVD